MKTIAAILVVLCLSGCGFRKAVKQKPSPDDLYLHPMFDNVIVQDSDGTDGTITIGFTRKITLYSADGSQIRQWRVKSKVENRGGTCDFFTDDNKLVTIAGTFIVEQE